MRHIYTYIYIYILVWCCGYYICCLLGQFRGFDLAEYTSEYPDPAPYAVPWAVGDDAIPDSVAARSSSSSGATGPGIPSLDRIFAQVCAKPKFVVLHVSCYFRLAERQSVLDRLRRELQMLLPLHDIKLVSVEGPFEDDEGNGSHFDGAKHCGLTGLRLVKAFRVDLFTSAAKVLRSIATHHPDVVVGDGQGSLVAGILRYPLVVETVLQARNIQREEAYHIGAAWSTLALS